MQDKHDRRLTIFMVTNNYTPYGGGIVSSLTAVVSALREQGHRVVIITLDFGVAVEPETDVERISCVMPFCYKGNHMALPIFVKRSFRALIEKYKPCIIHVHHPFLLGPVAVACARERGIPTIFTYHTLYERYVHYVPLPACVITPLTRLWVRSFCGMVDHIIAPSEWVARHLSNKLSKPKSISVLPSPLLAAFTPSAVKDIRTTRKMQLLTVSRFSPEKNITWLITMFGLLATRFPGRYHFKLIGYGPELSLLKTEAYERYGLSREDILFIERPERQELVKAYQDADLFLFASQSETQGIVLIEALSQATPVIALDGPAIQDTIKPQYNGFIVNSHEQMIEKIQFLDENLEAYKTLSENAYTSAKNYTATAITQKLLAQYRALL